MIARARSVRLRQRECEKSSRVCDDRRRKKRDVIRKVSPFVCACECVSVSSGSPSLPASPSADPFDSERGNVVRGNQRARVA